MRAGQWCIVTGLLTSRPPEPHTIRLQAEPKPPFRPRGGSATPLCTRCGPFRHINDRCTTSRRRLHPQKTRTGRSGGGSHATPIHSGLRGAYGFPGHLTLGSQLRDRVRCEQDWFGSLEIRGTGRPVAVCVETVVQRFLVRGDGTWAVVARRRAVILHSRGLTGRGSVWLGGRVSLTWGGRMTG